MFCHTTILKEQLFNAKKKIAELQEKLRINEAFLQEMAKSWEQKLAEAERIHKVGGWGQEGWEGLKGVGGAWKGGWVQDSW